MADVTEIITQGAEVESRREGKRREIAKACEEIMTRWKFIPDRKRGRPSKYANVGRDRAVDVGVVLLLIEATSWGCTDTEARVHADISQTAFDNFCKLNPLFKSYLAEKRQHPTVIARNSVTMGMKNSGELALKYLERKLPDEFSLKGNVTHSFEFTGITLERPKLIESEVIKDDTLEAP
jgi:hypothetical protein